jgi:O-antigen/teichoic acid export membrane protein
MGLIFVNLARYFIDIYHPHLQGYFGIIIMPLSLILLLFSFISTPAILHLSNAYNNQDFHILHRSISKIIGGMLVVTVLFCTLMYFFGAPLLQLLFNIDFSNYIIDVVLVVLIGLAISLTSLFTNVAIIARKLRLTSAIYLLSNVLLALLCMLLVSQCTIRGAIIAYIIASTIQAIAMGIYYYHLTRNYKLSKKS